MNELSVPEGFTMDVRYGEGMTLATIKNYRAHPGFKGDRSADVWPGICRNLLEAGLDPAKAVVALGCREEPIRIGRRKTFSVGVVHLGWAGAPICLGPPATRAAREKRGNGQCRRGAVRF